MKMTQRQRAQRALDLLKQEKSQRDEINALRRKLAETKRQIERLVK